MKRYMIEREVPGIGALPPCEMSAVAARSNEALAQLQGRAEWVHSYVTANKTFCIYLAKDESAIHEHARLSGFPANRITEIVGIIDSSTAG